MKNTQIVATLAFSFVLSLTAPLITHVACVAALEQSSATNPSSDVASQDITSSQISSATDSELSTSNPSDVPDTGNVADQGIISAVSTVAPLLIGAGFMLMFFSGKIHERQRLRRLAAIEHEIDAEVEEIVDEPEERDPAPERFVAEPIARDEPVTTTVDPFAPRKTI